MVINLLQANHNVLESFKAERATAFPKKEKEKTTKEKEDEITVEIVRQVLWTYKELMEEIDSFDSEHANDPPPSKIAEIGNDETKIQVEFGTKDTKVRTYTPVL